MNELEKLHSVHLEILDEFVRICDELNIEYFLIAGTMLGAVRHQGFIPWDDDLDIGVLREDYEYLVSELPKHLDDNFHYMTPDETKGYATPFLKIMKSGTELGEANIPNDLQNYGIFIDVFPYDNVPISKLSRFHHKLTTELLKRMLLIKCNYNINIDSNIFKKVAYTLIRFMTLFFSENSLKNKLYKNSIRYNNEHTEFVTNIGGSYGYEKEVIRSEWLENLELYKFEHNKYLGFKDYDQYLKGLYGNYMELPPEEKRGNRHNYKFVKF